MATDELGRELRWEWEKAVKQVELLITHKGCADGVASAMIAHAALGCDVQLCRYRDKLHQDPPIRQGVLYCDMSPPDDELIQDQLIACGTLVLDHHLSQQHLMTRFGELARFHNDLCGAQLAYKHVWLPVKGVNHEHTLEVRRFANLCGIYDLWRTDSQLWDYACALREGLMLADLGDLLGRVPILELLHDEISAGWMMLKRQRLQVQELANNVLPCGQVAIIGQQSLISKVSEALVGSSFDIVAGFTYRLVDEPYRHLALSVSLRSPGDRVDVSEIAKRHGGGGHRSAAGFMILGQTGDPVNAILNALEG